MSQSLARPGACANAPHAASGGALGPILAALCRVVSPGAAPPHMDYRRALGANPDVTSGGACPGGEDPARAFRRRMAAHALVYLARHKFGCPGLDAYNFGLTCPNGVFSRELDRELEDPGMAGRGGEMKWDADGRFARLVAEHGQDPDWLCIAAAICILDHALNAWELAPSRNDLLEEVHLECNVFSRGRMSQVHDELCEHGIVQARAPRLRARQ